MIVSKDACGRDVRTKPAVQLRIRCTAFRQEPGPVRPPAPTLARGALHVASLALCFVTRALPSISPLPLLTAQTLLQNFLEEKIPESMRVMSKNSDGINDLAPSLSLSKWLPRGSALLRRLSQLTGTLFPAFTMGTFNSGFIEGVSLSLVCALLNPQSRNDLFTVLMQKTWPPFSDSL